jgi:hypothetical protein
MASCPNFSVKPKDVIVLNYDSGDPNMHALNAPQETSRRGRA